MLPLIVFAAMGARYELVMLLVVNPIVPVDVMVPPDKGDWAVIDVMPVTGYVVCVYFAI